MKTRGYVEHNGKRIYDGEYTTGTEVFCEHCDEVISDPRAFCVVRVSIISQEFSFTVGSDGKDDEQTIIHPNCIFLFLRDKIMEAAKMPPTEVSVFS